MSITCVPPDIGMTHLDCSACFGVKLAPIATVVTFDAGHGTDLTTVVLCQECGRDAANAIGFMCVREGGWSKLEPRKRVRK